MGLGSGGVIKSFEEIFTEHIDMLYGMAYRWTQNQQEAEDLVQDLAIKLMDDVEKLQSLGKVSSWMVRVMYRLFVDKYRRAKMFTVMPSDEIEPVIEQHDDHADIGRLDDHYHQGQVIEGLLGALDDLDGPQRVAISLFEIEGYSLQEIADVQGVSTGTVKSRLFRAKQHLRKSVSLEPFAPPNRVMDRG